MRKCKRPIPRRVGDVREGIVMRLREEQSGKPIGGQASLVRAFRVERPSNPRSSASRTVQLEIFEVSYEWRLATDVAVAD